MESPFTVASIPERPANFRWRTPEKQVDSTLRTSSHD